MSTNIHWACTVCGAGSSGKQTAQSVRTDSAAHSFDRGHFTVFDDGRAEVPADEGTLTPAEFGALITAERVRQSEKGYTREHDEQHGVDHLLRWAEDYARRGKPVQSAALVRAARETLAAELQKARAEERELVAQEVERLAPRYTSGWRIPAAIRSQKIILDIDTQSWLADSAADTSERSYPKLEYRVRQQRDERPLARPSDSREHGMSDSDDWEYGFYDSHPAGNWQDDPEPQSNPTIHWYVFGILTHETADSAEHTGRKNTNGRPVIVRRIKGTTNWEHVFPPASSPTTPPQEGKDT